MPSTKGVQHEALTPEEHYRLERAKRPNSLPTTVHDFGVSRAMEHIGNGSYRIGGKRYTSVDDR